MSAAVTVHRLQGRAAAAQRAWLRPSHALGIVLLVALTGCGTLAAPALPSSVQSSTVHAAALPAGALAQPLASGSVDQPAAAGTPAGQPSAQSLPPLPGVLVEPMPRDATLAPVQQTPPVEPPAAMPAPPSAGLPDVPSAAALPDGEPIPRVETPRPGSNRPYMVKGRQYVPQAALTDHNERGLASWYGQAFHGRPTASGERFDMHALTAAHKTLPIPSTIRVTHVRSGRSVVVRVNDRGPFSGDRVLDLSYAAAQRLGFAHQGTAEVQIELLAAPAGLSLAARTNRRPELASASGPAASSPVAAALPASTTTPSTVPVTAPEQATAGLSVASIEPPSPEGDVAP